MYKAVFVMLALVMLPVHAQAEPVLDEETVKAISQEMLQAVKNGNFAPFQKYMYPGSKIVVDLDPSNSAGQTEISYDEFMSLTQMALGMMQGADIQDEVISISVDERRNQATIVEKTTTVLDMMGTRIRDVSVSETTYGVVDGQIKVLSTEDQLISSGPVQ